MNWLIPVTVLLLTVLHGFWKARRDDLPKQRDKFGRHILKADDYLRPRGFTLKEHSLKHGIIFGHGRAVWVNDRGEQATIESDRL